MSIHADAEKESKRGSFGYSDIFLYKFMFRYVTPYKRELIVILGYMLVTSLLAIVGPILLMSTIDRFSDPNYIIFEGSFYSDWFYAATEFLGYNLSLSILWIDVIVLSSIYLVAQLLIFFFSSKQILAIADLGLKAELSIRLELFTHLQELDLSYHDKNEIGRIMSRLTSDLSAIRQMLGGQVINNMANVITVIFVLVIIIALDPFLSIISIVFIPVAILVGTIARKYTRPKRKETRRTNSILMANIGEAIAGIKVTKGLNREQGNIVKFKELNQANYQANINADNLNAVFFPILLSLSSLGLAFLVYFGGLRVIAGLITLGVLTAFLNYNAILFRPVIRLGQFYQQLQDALTGAERVYALLDTDTKVPWNKHLPGIDHIKGDIVFDNVTFEYIPNNPIYENFNLTIPAGTTVALVGHTGAGKSTIINILSRMYKIKSGRLLIDGKDIEDYSLISYRAQIASVPQDFFLFAESVRFNLLLGKPSATDEEMWDVLDQVGLKDYIDRMPKKLGTSLQERGGRLSTGQRQLLVFATILLADPRILLLDEATAAVDIFSELQVQKTLNYVLKGDQPRTAFIIAHRLSTIRSADTIIVIDDGKIVEQGTHEELLAKKDKYYNLVKHQIEMSFVSN